MIQLIVFIIFINSALLKISAIPSTDLLPISNDTSNNTILKEELIKNYLQHYLPNSKDFHKSISKLSNSDIKNIRDQLNEKKYKFTRPIVGELITAIEAMRMAIQSLNRTVGLAQVNPTTGRLLVDASGTTQPISGNLNTISQVSLVANTQQISGQISVPLSLERNAADNLRNNIIVT